MKKIILIFSLCLITDYLFSQDFGMPPAAKKPAKENKFSFDKDKVYFGGGVGLAFTQYEILADLSPAIGYKLTDRFSVGTGVVYNYYKNSAFKPPFTLNIYGGTIFSRYLITDFLFAHAEYQPLNGPWKLINGSLNGERFFIHNVWVGGGFRQAMGDNASLLFSILWNVNESQYSYPLSPQIRVGMFIGL